MRTGKSSLVDLGTLLTDCEIWMFSELSEAFVCYDGFQWTEAYGVSESCSVSCCQILDMVYVQAVLCRICKEFQWTLNCYDQD